MSYPEGMSNASMIARVLCTAVGLAAVASLNRVGAQPIALPAPNITIPLFTPIKSAPSSNNFKRFTTTFEVLNPMELRITKDAKGDAACATYPSYAVFPYRTSLGRAGALLRLELSTSKIVALSKLGATTQVYQKNLETPLLKLDVPGMPSLQVAVFEAKADAFSAFKKTITITPGIADPRALAVGLQPGTHRLTFTVKDPASTNCIHVDLTVPVFRSLQ